MEGGRGRVNYISVVYQYQEIRSWHQVKIWPRWGLVCDYKVNRLTACESHKAQTHVILCAFCRLLVASTNSEINARSAIQAARPTLNGRRRRRRTERTGIQGKRLDPQSTTVEFVEIYWL